MARDSYVGGNVRNRRRSTRAGQAASEVVAGKVDYGMTVKKACLWEFELGLQSDSDLIQCPECGEYNALKEWREGTVGCEDCGEHTAMVCPACERAFDRVFSDPFKVTLNTRLRKGPAE